MGYKKKNIEFRREDFPKAFPKLTEEQIDAIKDLAECRTYDDGTVLIRAGETEFKFHVLKKGAIDIFDKSGEEPVLLLTHEPFEFTGDVANLTGRASNVDAIAKGKVEVYEICSEELKSIIGTRPEMSEVILTAFIERSRALEEIGYAGLTLIGSLNQKNTFDLREFLTKNRVLFTFIDAEKKKEAGEFCKHFHITDESLPAITFGTEWIMEKPEISQLADKLGLRHHFKEDIYDIVIVGAGPAGLAAAVYASSEGLKTALLESFAPGGQAGTSSKIENYLGFPVGVSGKNLSARAMLQAEKFGVHLDVATPALNLELQNGHKVVDVGDGKKINARTLLIASGAEYRKLGLENIGKFEGRGIYYAATNMEVALCGRKPVAVVGGGNSAGQAAVFLSEHVEKVYILIRGESLSHSMSNYLIEYIHGKSNIEIIPFCQITEIHGEKNLEGITVTLSDKKENRKLDVTSIFSFIGAEPNTKWLPSEIDKDSRGFILTGNYLKQNSLLFKGRQPYLLETSYPGVFAAGDVRCHSIKRVASAVGEGSMTVQFVHEYLRDN